MMPSVHISKFVRRQTAESPYSHWTIDDATLIARVVRSASIGWCKPGYRDGVMLVQIPVDGLYSSVTQLKEGDLLIGQYLPRQKGEEPRKSSFVIGDKTPAKRVDVVLYSHAVLAENNEQDSDADYEIISVNASPTNEEIPLSVGTLIANHFELSGGTSTKMNDSEFVSALRNSVMFWKDKALVAPAVLAKRVK